jgi:hypothetical protein
MTPAETIYMLALSAIAKDENLKCECGYAPYVDGEELKGKTVRHRRRKGKRGRKLGDLIATQRADQDDRHFRFEYAIGK